MSMATVILTSQKLSSFLFLNKPQQMGFLKWNFLIWKQTAVVEKGLKSVWKPHLKHLSFSFDFDSSQLLES